jgi:nitronate monooxygenase
MTLTDLKNSLRLPVIVAPMLLVSGPELAIAASMAGVVGTVPAANARTVEDLQAWLVQIEDALRSSRDARPDAKIAPYAVNLIVRHAGEARFEADLALIARFRVPIVITSVGNPAPVVERVHQYGGLVFHDIATLRHAQKAIAAGVDGLIVLTAGAGGHTGVANPFALVPQIRRIWDGAILLAGAISEAVRSVQPKCSARISPIWARASRRPKSRTRPLPTKRCSSPSKPRTS